MAPRIEDMNPKDEAGIDREAWRRQLGDAGAPSSMTDARIRAEARRALTPRIGRWWLPASLAASLMLAVFVVQWQVENDRRAPFVGESDLMILKDAPAQAPEPAPQSVPAPTVEAPAPMIDVPLDESRESKLERGFEEYAADAAAPAAPPVTAPQKTAPTPAAAAESQSVTGALSQRTRADSKLRTPEQWFAEIEALRASGKNAEADAELARLEEAYPGWLEQHRSGNP